MPTFKELVLFGFVIFGIPSIVIVVSFVGGSVQCSEQWEHSGFKYQYKLFAGCLIETTPNNWIPAANYRDIAGGKQ